MRTTSTQPGPDEPGSPPNPFEPAIPGAVPVEVPITPPLYFPDRPDIPTEPIHEPTPERPIA